jgi:hypothetical protein
MNQETNNENIDQIIYVPTEGNIPIVKASRLSEFEKTKLEK